MQWMVPENRLGQEQTLILAQCVKSGDSCNWIQGFAGSGKTVLLVHAIETLRATQSGQSICFVTFTHALKDLVSTGLSDKAKSLPIFTVDRFIKEGKHFDIVLADEIQDLEEHKLKRLKVLSGRLIVAGDVDQSIYRSGVGANEIRTLLLPNIYRLTVLYRLTQTLQFLAKALLPGTPIVGAKVQRQQDTDIVLARAQNQQEEAEWVINKAMTLARPGNPSVIILPTQECIFEFIELCAEAKGVDAPERRTVEVSFERNRSGRSDKLDWDAINADMDESGLPIRFLGSSFGDLLESDTKPLTYVMTYHSAKGLDFPHVFLPRMNSTIQLWRGDEDLERRLFFVGITRSRENLFITYSSREPHRLVRELPERHLKIQECSRPVTASNRPTDEYLF